jgi:hypothetical protein
VTAVWYVWPCVVVVVLPGAGVSRLVSFTSYQHTSALHEFSFVDPDDEAAIASGAMWSAGRLTHAAIRFGFAFATLAYLNSELRQGEAPAGAAPASGPAAPTPAGLTGGVGGGAAGVRA